MTEPARRLWWIVCILVFATVCGAQPLPPPPAVPGQPAQEPGGPATPAGPAPAGGVSDAQLLWRDIRLLSMVSWLGLSPEQTAQVTAQLEWLQTQITSARATRSQIWQQSWQPVSNVVNAWLAGTDPAPEAKAQADSAALQAQSTDDAVKAAEDQVRQAFLGLLTPEQRQLVETAEDAGMRRDAMRVYAGAPSLADYVVRQLDAQRTLMPDEYQLIRQPAAAVITRKVTGPESPDAGVVQEAVLRLLDQVYALSDADYAAARPGLAGQIRQYLDLANDPVARPISFEDLGDWLRDPRTPAYLKIRGTTADSLPPTEEPAPDELRNALESARIASLLNDLAVSPVQANRLLAVAQRASGEVTTNEAAGHDVVAAVAQPLGSILPYYISARPVTAEADRLIADTREKLRMNKDALDAALAPLVEAVRQQLTAEQASLVDWRVPPEVSGLMDAFQQLRAAEMLSDAAALAASLRMVNRTEFYGTRTERTEAFLEKYMQPEGPGFEAAVDRVKEELVEVYRMSREQWEQDAFLVASRIVRSAGLSQETAWRPSDRPLDWYAIRDLLLAPQTTGVLQQMVQLRTGN